tara:strand:- start:292 stop:795 length:504 start_codon:yes stop_codon:yes gene_type:complete
MKHSKIYDLNKNFDPLDLVEDLIVNNNWHYERDQDDNIHVEVGGEWCDYQLSFGFNGKTELVYISCALDIKVPQNRINEVCVLVAKINEKLKLGHFEVWLDDGWPIFRHTLPVSDKSSVYKKQIEKISLMALQECERFYPAFQFLAWGNKSANESINHLMLETHGEA